MILLRNVSKLGQDNAGDIIYFDTSSKIQVYIPFILDIDKNNEFRISSHSLI